MGVRTNVELTFQIGRDNALLNFVSDEELSQLLDTLDHGESGIYTLAAGETNRAVSFGDVAEARLVYICSDNDIRVTPGAPGLATAASRDGVAGTFPTGFTGGETLELDVDNFGSIITTFTSGASLLADVNNEINAAFALGGFLSGGLPFAPLRDNGGGEMRILSPTTGIASEVEVVAGSAGVLATLGLSAGVTLGVNAIAGQTSLELQRPASTAFKTGLRTFFLGTLRTTSLLLDNLDTASAARVVVAIAGDVLATPPTDC